MSCRSRWENPAIGVTTGPTRPVFVRAASLLLLLSNGPELSPPAPLASQTAAAGSDEWSSAVSKGKPRSIGALSKFGNMPF